MTIYTVIINIPPGKLHSKITQHVFAYNMHDISLYIHKSESKAQKLTFYVSINMTFPTKML